MYLVISLGVAATSIVNVIGCTEVKVEPSTNDETVLSNCVSSWVIIFFITVIYLTVKTQNDISIFFST